jgi:predicted nucleotidyltransferase component of viral defense system
MADIFDQMLSRYEILTKDDERNAKHEVMQQIALAGLYRAQFFDKAAFYGGTCLRIFHGLQRFSEDMDFSLLKKDEDFSIENYFDSIENEFKALGRKVEIYKKEKKGQSHVESAFLKDNTDIYNIQFLTEPSIKIKLEVDKDPPLFFQTEHKLLLLPFSFMTRCLTLSGLFAGKMHAFLFRIWRNRVKGRDWYDFEWYIRNQIPIDFNHFLERTIQSESIKRGSLTRNEFRKLVKKKIDNTKIGLVTADVSPFIKNPKDLEIWSNDYFLQLVDLIQFE